MASMRQLLPFLIAGSCLQTVNAQQLPQFSQYNSLDYLYDPAVAGSRPWFEVRSAHRNQWVGIQDAPRTFLLSTTTPIAANMGLGGYIFTDHVGPSRRTGVQFSYAYHLRINEQIKLGMGLSFGLLQFLIDGSKIQMHDADDPLMDDQLRGALMPDATFGLYLYHDQWWFGAAAPQLMRNKVKFFDTNDPPTACWRRTTMPWADTGLRLANNSSWNRRSWRSTWIPCRPKWILPPRCGTGI